jgi:hypothetical protein
VIDEVGLEESQSKGEYDGPRTLIRLWSHLESPEDTPFSAVAKAHRQWAIASLVPDPDANQQLLEKEAAFLYRELRRTFRTYHGRIVHEYYCRDAIGAAMLTATPHEATNDPRQYIARRALHTVLNTADDLFQELELKCDAIVNDAVAVFQTESSQSQLEFAAEAAYQSMAAVLFVVDAIEGKQLTAPQERVARAAVRKRVQTTAQQAQILIQRHARFSYFMGVLAGSGAALALCGITGCLSAAYWNHYLHTALLTVAMVMGVLGAVVSVFQRISSGQLVLDYTAPRRQRIILGSIRPFVGALFGAVIYFALGSGLIATTAQAGSTDVSASIGLFALTGFIAGFSERFATDMLERAGSLLLPSVNRRGMDDTEAG